MPTTTRNGLKAQKAARAAAEAKRASNSVRHDPASGVAGGGVDDAVGDVSRGAASPTAATGVGAPIGSPEYLAGFPSLGSPDKVAAAATTDAAVGGRGAHAPARPGRSDKSVKALSKGAKAAKSVPGDVNGSDAVDSNSSAVVVSLVGASGPVGPPEAANVKLSRRVDGCGDRIETFQLERALAASAVEGKDAGAAPVRDADESASPPQLLQLKLFACIALRIGL